MAGCPADYYAHGLEDGWHVPMRDGPGVIGTHGAPAPHEVAKTHYRTDLAQDLYNERQEHLVKHDVRRYAEQHDQPESVRERAQQQQ